MLSPLQLRLLSGAGGSGAGRDSAGAGGDCTVTGHDSELNMLHASCWLVSVLQGSRDIASCEGPSSPDTGGRLQLIKQSEPAVMSCFKNGFKLLCRLVLAGELQVMQAPQAPTLAAGCRRRCHAPACGRGCAMLRGSCKTWRCGHLLRWRLWGLVAALHRLRPSSSTETGPALAPGSALSEQQLADSKLNQSNFGIIQQQTHLLAPKSATHALGNVSETPLCSASCLGHLKYSAAFTRPTLF